MSNLRKSVKVTNNRQLGFEDDKDLRSWIEGEQAKGRLALEVWATFNIARKVHDRGTGSTKVVGWLACRERHSSLEAGGKTKWDLRKR